MESDRGWYERIRPQLPSNVVYQWIDMHATPEQYWEITDGEVGRYDLVLVDGMLRDYCIRSAIHAVRPGGYVYLDNIDSTGRAAFPILRDAVKARGGSLELLTGFPPAQPTITTGALAHF
jgi:predicted O-methyltransferase YrrM